MWGIKKCPSLVVFNLSSLFVLVLTLARLPASARTVQLRVSSWPHLYPFMWRSLSRDAGVNIHELSDARDTGELPLLRAGCSGGVARWHHRLLRLFGGNEKGRNQFADIGEYQNPQFEKLNAFSVSTRSTSLAWYLIYKHHFSPHSNFIWNNGDILYKSNVKSLFFPNCVNVNIILVSQLLNADGY